MKTNAIIRILLFSLAILILGSILLGFVAYDLFSFTDRAESREEHIDMHSGLYSVDPDVIDSIHIEWAAGSITIVRGEDALITVSESGVTDEKYAMQLDENGNTLHIQYCEDKVSFFGFGNHSLDRKDLVIHVPSYWMCDSLEIDAAAADVTVKDLTIQEVDFDGASAVCNFENCLIVDMEVDTASGDVSFSGSLDQLDFDAMSAGFNGIFNNIPQQIDVDSMSGDLDIALPEECGFRVELDAMSGNFTSDFSCNKTDDTYLCGDGRCRINVSAMSGDVNIRKNTSH